MCVTLYEILLQLMGVLMVNIRLVMPLELKQPCAMAWKQRPINLETSIFRWGVRQKLL
jgi:hypothetical protein